MVLFLRRHRNARWDEVQSAIAYLEHKLWPQAAKTTAQLWPELAASLTADGSLTRGDDAGPSNRPLSREARALALEHLRAHVPFDAVVSMLSVYREGDGVFFSYLGGPDYFEHAQRVFGVLAVYEKRELLTNWLAASARMFASDNPRACAATISTLASRDTLWAQTSLEMILALLGEGYKDGFSAGCPFPLEVLFQRLLQEGDGIDLQARGVRARLALLLGHWSTAREDCSAAMSEDIAVVRYCLDFYEGVPDAQARLVANRKAAAAGTKGAKPKKRLPYPLEVLQVVQGIVERTPAALDAVAALWVEPPKMGDDYGASHSQWRALVDQLQGRRAPLRAEDIQWRSVGLLGWWPLIQLGCVVQFAGISPLPSLLEALERAASECLATRPWFAAECYALLGQLGNRSDALEAASALCAKLGMARSLATSVPRVEAWEHRLEALRRAINRYGNGDEETSAEPQSARLIWVMYYGEQGGLGLSLKEQKLGKGGQWTSGRAVSAEHLVANPPNLPSCATPLDHQIAKTHFRSWSGMYTEVATHWSKALPLLAKHPAAFISYREELHPAEFVEKQPEIHLETKGDSISLGVRPEGYDPDRVHVSVTRPSRVVYALPRPDLRWIVEVLGSRGATFPATALPKLRALLPSLSAHLPVHTEADADDAAAAEPGDPRPCFVLIPQGLGLMVELAVRPSPALSHTLLPGRGGRTLYVKTSDKSALIKRDLTAEVSLATSALVEVGLLDAGSEPPEDWRFDVSHPIAALELLTALGALADTVTVEWPEGKKLAAPREVGTQAVKVNVTRAADWFSIGGEVALSAEERIEFGALLEAARKSKSRFVTIDNDKVLALSQDLRKKIDAILALSESSAKGQRFSRAASLALESTLSEFGEHGRSGDFKEWLNQLRRAQGSEPVVPASFREVLRPYQAEGFAWMARLASLGLGACLADDMGLGKTVQALALLVYRAARGPALVVAPTSVANNWLAEARRFAPELRVSLFGDGSRELALEQAHSGSVLVCTYGLVLNEIEKISAVKWGTVILDEAQFIKNAATKRSQAVMEIEAEFRLITTGTPLENHLGELWNLFRFAVPGLLGSQARFNERFAIPIERAKDPAARKHLKALISPFILRRTKGQVLDELPARTEITVGVDLSPEERALYDEARQRALETVNDLDAPAEKKRFQVLAELMRLRRLACNPKLVVGAADVPSAKEETFFELVDELRQSGHRALVFSQFVDHLQLVKAKLDARGISHQYLDGSTPQKERAKSVAEFQAGAGELFLISLKAGGVGLNLTGADYVIHLDPWWNPAVEDQASDRAHRIGQTRPVTIYRLVANNTVESRIVALHRDKRDLASSLLEGTDTAARVSVDDLLALM
jgi:superfamily II DNA or RNA helicase